MPKTIFGIFSGPNTNSAVFGTRGESFPIGGKTQTMKRAVVCSMGFKLHARSVQNPNRVIRATNNQEMAGRMNVTGVDFKVEGETIDNVKCLRVEEDHSIADDINNQT